MCNATGLVTRWKRINFVVKTKKGNKQKVFYLVGLAHVWSIVGGEFQKGVIYNMIFVTVD